MNTEKAKPGDIIRINGKEFNVVECPSNRDKSKVWINIDGSVKWVIQDYEIIKRNDTQTIINESPLEWEERMRQKKHRAIAEALGFKD